MGEHDGLELVCGHDAFHKQCLESWWKQHWIHFGVRPQCPICRAKIHEHGLEISFTALESAAVVAAVVQLRHPQHHEGIGVGCVLMMIGLGVMLIVMVCLVVASKKN